MCRLQLSGELAGSVSDLTTTLVRSDMSSCARRISAIVHVPVRSQCRRAGGMRRLRATVDARAVCRPGELSERSAHEILRTGWRGRPTLSGVARECGGDPCVRCRA